MFEEISVGPLRSTIDPLALTDAAGVHSRECQTFLLCALREYRTEMGWVGQGFRGVGIWEGGVTSSLRLALDV